MKTTDRVFDQIIGKMEISLSMVQELETMLSDMSKRTHPSQLSESERERLVAAPSRAAPTRYLRQ